MSAKALSLPSMSPVCNEVYSALNPTTVGMPPNAKIVSRWILLGWTPILSPIISAYGTDSNKVGDVVRHGFVFRQHVH